MNDSSKPLDKTIAYKGKGGRPGFGRILESIVAAGKDLLSRTHKRIGLKGAPAEALTKLCQQHELTAINSDRNNHSNLIDNDPLQRIIYNLGLSFTCP